RARSVSGDVGPARASSGEPAGDQVPDRVGQGFLGAVRDGCLAAVGAQHHGLVLLRPEGAAHAHLVDDEQGPALALELGAAVGEAAVGRGGGAAGPLWGTGPAGGDLRQYVGVADQGDRLGLLAVLLLDLPGGVGGRAAVRDGG